MDKIYKLSPKTENRLFSSGGQRTKSNLFKTLFFIILISVLALGLKNTALGQETERAPTASPTTAPTEQKEAEKAKILETEGACQILLIKRGTGWKLQRVGFSTVA